MCTNDACDPATGCTHTNNTDPCSDGNACTTTDTCSGGACAGGTPVACNDGDGCTTDTCSPATGCVFTNNNDPCSDGNICTTGDACAGGMCLAGSPTNCDDGDPCTLESCACSGCVHENTACGACCLPSGPCADAVTVSGCEAIVPGGGVFLGVGSVCLGDADNDSLDDACDTPDNVPTTSEWGMVIMTLFLLTSAKIYFGRRPIAVKVNTDW